MATTEQTVRNVYDLKQGQRLRGLLPGEVTTLIAVDVLDDDCVEIAYRSDTGISGSRVMFSDEVEELTLIAEELSDVHFNADPNEFRLAAEALRIKNAARFDPYAAVHASNVRPLPHQIRAVYEEFLPRVPLRYLLADDPGAGKTIMAGLYLKELLLRSDLNRAIVVAPGGLVEQWRDELRSKFDLHFQVLTPALIEDANGMNVFELNPHLIVRMDQVSRNPDLLADLENVRWDVAVVDEAHRMSVHAWGKEVKETARFRMGKILSERAHNFLLMTATPHAGKEEDFQQFMRLIDEDRFAGIYRAGVHRSNTKGLMRRMVKEDLLTFEGKPLFPERIASTVSYELSPAEKRLYEDVTEYVRTQMGRARSITESGDKKRGNTIGFALTVLQRRLASSPEAIFQSLRRRRDRLSARLKEVREIRARVELSGPIPLSDLLHSDLPDIPDHDIDSLFDELTDEERFQFEESLETFVDLATASESVADLELEIASLDDLVGEAHRVRLLDEDRKWNELRSILESKVLLSGKDGSPRKIIVFTEHKDTLRYLESKISNLFGTDDAVVTIHGGTPRSARKRAQVEFTENPSTVVLLATDAAGEGLNLQRAHLMVNYDLPWNPNRIEQRFGRIHRIGQEEVCHLWNLVATDTREGEVFTRLLEKIESQSAAYNGNLFNVLGDLKAFGDSNLETLLMEAVLYGDDPERQRERETVIDAGVAKGLAELTRERALHPEMYQEVDLDHVRRRMEQARDRKLQPGYVEAFFIPAFRRLGGSITRKEGRRYEINRVPKRIQQRALLNDRLAPVPNALERVAFDVKQVQVPGMADAALLAPGHPLLESVLDLTIADLAHTLSEGAVFIDRRSKQLDTPALLYTVEQRIESGGEPARIVSHHFDYAEVSEGGVVSVAVAPPYLDYESPRPDEAPKIRRILNLPLVKTRHDREVKTWAYREGLIPRKREIQERLDEENSRAAIQVKQRLTAEINYWEGQYTDLLDAERSGKPGKIKSETALARARAYEEQLKERLTALQDQTSLKALPATIRGVALVIPSRLLEDEYSAHTHHHARETEEVDQRAVAAAMRAERSLGRIPTEMPHNNPGYDIRSETPSGEVYFIEVKGRIEGGDTFTVTQGEIAEAQTQGDRHRLALVRVSPEGPDRDQIVYVGRAFDHMRVADTTRSVNEKWATYWRRGSVPF